MRSANKGFSPENKAFPDWWNSCWLFSAKQFIHCTALWQTSAMYKLQVLPYDSWERCQRARWGIITGWVASPLHGWHRETENTYIHMYIQFWMYVQAVAQSLHNSFNGKGQLVCKHLPANHRAAALGVTCYQSKGYCTKFSNYNKVKTVLQSPAFSLCARRKKMMEPYCDTASEEWRYGHYF